MSERPLHRACQDWTGRAADGGPVGDLPVVVGGPLVAGGGLTDFVRSNQQMACVLGISGSRRSERAWVSVAGSFGAIHVP